MPVLAVRRQLHERIIDDAMPMLQTIGTLVALAGIAIRLMTWRRYFDLYAAVRGSSPPRTWLWTPDPDPAIEKARLPLAAGSVIAVVGLGLVVVGLLTG